MREFDSRLIVFSDKRVGSDDIKNNQKLISRPFSEDICWIRVNSEDKQERFDVLRLAVYVNYFCSFLSSLNFISHLEDA